MIDYLPPKDSGYHSEIDILYPNKKCKSITFQVTEDCNLRCTYCYQHNKSHNKMSFETAKKFIDDLLNDKYSIIQKKEISTLTIDFIGGEPLLEIELIFQICNYIIQKMIKLHHPWLPLLRFNICSNGVLYFNKEVQQFFKKFYHWTSYTISIDGNKQLHDSCRIDLYGQGSYDRAIKAVKTYKKQYNIQMETKLTISPDNISYLYDAIINLINEGYTQIPANCIFENVWHDIKYAQIFYQQLKKIADYLLNNNLYNKIYISLFEENNFQPINKNNNQNWCGGIADTNLSLDYQGNFYPCIRYMDSSLNGNQEPIIIGNINTGYLITEKDNKNYQKINNITRRSQSTNECFYCPIGQGCAWCSAFNYEEFGTVNKRATYICIMHQARALANHYYWNMLYKKLNIDKKKKLYLEKEKCLQIISQDEYNLLLNI